MSVGWSLCVCVLPIWVWSIVIFVNWLSANWKLCKIEKEKKKTKFLRKCCVDGRCHYIQFVKRIRIQIGRLFGKQVASNKRIQFHQIYIYTDYDVRDVTHTRGIYCARLQMLHNSENSSPRIGCNTTISHIKILSSHNFLLSSVSVSFLSFSLFTNVNGNKGIDC